MEASGLIERTVSTAARLDIKVVYDARSRQRGGRQVKSYRPRRGRRWTPMHIAMVNLLAAAALYYGTWWQGDPEIRLRLLMHTPLPGVDVEEAAAVFGPTGARPSSPRAMAGPASPETKRQTARAARFVGTALGWEALCTLAAFALALSGGALLGRAGGPAGRAAGIVLGLAGLSAVAWKAYGLWTQYGRFVPDQVRVDVGAAVLVLFLVGVSVARGVRPLTVAGAVLLILSACGSVLALYVGSQYGAVQPSELPMPLLPFAAVVFAIQSLWGWILLPMGWRLRL